MAVAASWVTERDPAEPHAALGRPGVGGCLRVRNPRYAPEGGRCGGPAAPATRRIYLCMVRALARQLGRPDVAAGVKVARHKAGPPGTLSEVEYENVLRVPDRRSVRGKRDDAMLRVLGDCGPRSAELRGLVARDVRRPRANARHLRLFVRGNGSSECEAPVRRRRRRRSRRGWSCI